MTNILEQNNNSKAWNSKARTRFRTEPVTNHFNRTNDVKTMHGETTDEQIGVTLRQQNKGCFSLCNENKIGNTKLSSLT